MAATQVSTEKRDALPPLSAGPYARRMDVIVIVATFGGLLFGYDTGVINGALKPMVAELGLTSTTEGMVTSFLLIGAAIGAMVAGRVNDLIGRRKTLIGLSIVFLVGTLGCVFTPGLVVMLASRFVLGLAVGGASVTVPVYLAELAPAERRGRLSGRNELAIVVGQFLAFVINAVIANVWGHHEGVWRYMLAICAIPAICLFFGMLKMPESPRWLVSKNRDEEALDVLKQVRPQDRALAELGEVRRVADEDAKLERGGWADLKIGWIRKLVIAGTGLAIVQQLTGINSVMYYGTQLLEDAGFEGDIAITANIANGVMSVGGTVLCLYIIDKFPRRKLMLFGLIGTTVMHLLTAIVSSAVPEGPGRAVATMITICLFVLCMQTCLNMPVWVALSEMFPLRIRGFAIGLAVFGMWIVNAMITFLFPILVEAINLSGVYAIFAVLGALSWFFTFRTLPETRGKSLEVLEEEFSQGKFF